MRRWRFSPRSSSTQSQISSRPISTQDQNETSPTKTRHSERESSPHSTTGPSQSITGRNENTPAISNTTIKQEEHHQNRQARHRRIRPSPGREHLAHLVHQEGHQQSPSHSQAHHNHSTEEDQDRHVIRHSIQLPGGVRSIHSHRRRDRIRQRPRRSHRSS